MRLEFLKPLYETSWPVASVYLDTTRATENAAKEIELRWRGLRERLAAEGADEATLAALDGAVGGTTDIPGPQGEALFAADGRLLEAHTLSRPPARDHASWSRIPDPVALALDLDGQLPYVVAAVDREGADVDAYDRHGHDPSAERSFNGSTLHIQKVRGGGMAHKNHQRRSENLWDENAGEAAKDVAAAIADVAAELVFVGGDERAIGKLREHLGRPALDLLVELPTGGRSDGAALDSLRANVDQALEVAVAQSQARAVEEFTAALGRDNAVQGLAATVEALRRAQVETVLLAVEREAEPRLWASADDPLEVSVDRNRLTDPDAAFEGPAEDLLLRAAVHGNAEFALLPDSGRAAEGVGAVLRFTTTE